MSLAKDSFGYSVKPLLRRAGVTKKVHPNCLQSLVERSGGTVVSDPGTWVRALVTAPLSVLGHKLNWVPSYFCPAGREEPLLQQPAFYGRS